MNEKETQRCSISSVVKFTKRAGKPCFKNIQLKPMIAGS